MVYVANESPPTDAAALAHSVRPVLLRIARELRREIHSLGVTGGRVSLVVQIKTRPGTTAPELAERERISAPGMSGHIARLEAAELIERTRAEDRRRIGLTVTDAGDKVLTNVRKRRTAWLAEHLKGLTDDEREAIEAALPA